MAVPKRRKPGHGPGFPDTKCQKRYAIEAHRGHLAVQYLGLHGLQAFLAAQGLQGLQAFLAAQGLHAFLAAQGLQAFVFAAPLQGLQAA